MKKIGIIGGFGPESTVAYYRSIIERYHEINLDESQPDILIYSMDINVLLTLLDNQQWTELTNWILTGIISLKKAGADFALIAANTPHIVFDQLQQISPIPLISIVEETCNKVKELGLSTVGLLGTNLTMQSNFYQNVFTRNQIKIIVPTSEEQAYIHNKLMTETAYGNFLETTRKGFLSIIKRMVDDDAIEGVILGCTELPLILTREEYNIPFLNTTQLHVDSVVRYCIS